MKKEYHNVKVKIITTSGSKEFELPGGLYTVSDINDYFLFTVQKHTKKHIEDTAIYINKIGNRVTFKLRTGVTLEFMTPQTQALLGSFTETVTGEKNEELVQQRETTEKVLICCHLVNNDYQHDSRMLYLFIPDNSFGQLLKVSPMKFIWLRTF